jgi:hypothetical protein
MLFPEDGIVKILDTCTSIKKASIPKLLCEREISMIKSLKMLYGVNYYGTRFGLAEMGTGGISCSSGASLPSATAAMVAQTPANVTLKIVWARIRIKSKQLLLLRHLLAFLDPF